MENKLSFDGLNRICRFLADHGLDIQGSIAAQEGMVVVDIIDENAFWLLTNQYKVSVVNDEGFLSAVIDGVTYTTQDFALQEAHAGLR